MNWQFQHNYIKTDLCKYTLHFSFSTTIVRMILSLLLKLQCGQTPSHSRPSSFWSSTHLYSSPSKLSQFFHLSLYISFLYSSIYPIYSLLLSIALYTLSTNLLLPIALYSHSTPYHYLLHYIPSPLPTIIYCTIYSLHFLLLSIALYTLSTPYYYLLLYIPSPLPTIIYCSLFLDSSLFFSL